MHALVLGIGILLVGQVADRYGDFLADPPVESQPAETFNFEDELSPAAAAAAFEESPVTPTAEPPSASRSERPQVKPSQLLANLTAPPVGGRLTGERITLAEAVSGAASRGDQMRRVERYWELWQAVADYRLALRDATELATVRNGLLQPTLAWSKASERFDERRDLALQRAKSLQRQFGAELGRTAPGELPLPGDAPHCGDYDTRYDLLFASRTSDVAAELNQLLPLQFDQIRRQADELAGAYARLDRFRSQSNANLQGDDVLAMFELLVAERRAFVESVRSYNVSIARYSAIATPGSIPTGRLVAMLIHKEPTAEGDWHPSGGVEQASAEEPVDSRPPATFTNEAPFENSRPLPRQETPRGERSILVPK